MDSENSILNNKHSKDNTKLKKKRSHAHRDGSSRDAAFASLAVAAIGVAINNTHHDAQHLADRLRESCT